MIRTALLSTAALALTVTATLASPTNSILSNGAALTSGSRVQGTAAHHNYLPPRGTVIFDSIGTGGYNCCSGWTVSAASSVIGTQYWPADQITPTGSGKVTSLVVGVGYVTGTNGAELAIYKDAAGIPGKMLWSGDVSNLPNFGSTGTTTVTAKVTGAKIRANKPFWVAIQTDANSTQTWDAWNQSNTTEAPIAENSGSGWVNDGTTTAGAMTVYGRVR